MDLWQRKQQIKWQHFQPPPKKREINFKKATLSPDIGFKKNKNKNSPPSTNRKTQTVVNLMRERQ